MLLRFVFWSALSFAVVMALLPHPPMLPPDLDDKALHILAFATLSVLGAAAYPGTRLWKLGGALCMLGAAIEFAQMIPLLNRDAQLGDWTADALAVVITLGAVAVIRHVFAEPSPGTR